MATCSRISAIVRVTWPQRHTWSMSGDRLTSRTWSDEDPLARGAAARSLTAAPVVEVWNMHSLRKLGFTMDRPPVTRWPIRVIGQADGIILPRGDKAGELFGSPMAGLAARLATPGQGRHMPGNDAHLGERRAIAKPTRGRVWRRAPGRSSEPATCQRRSQAAGMCATPGAAQTPGLGRAARSPRRAAQGRGTSPARPCP